TRELPFGPFLCASQYAFTFYPGGLW
ncbi:TPA: prepilin peptidase, partial [Escherichia coli]|nr:prepilin peptidase [Shigella sonnei]EGD9175570.1 prepilin peptidase [Shigella sonnei]